VKRAIHTAFFMYVIPNFRRNVVHLAIENAELVDISGNWEVIQHDPRALPPGRKCHKNMAGSEIEVIPELLAP
jgi:hypothetical protein